MCMNSRFIITIASFVVVSLLLFGCSSGGGGVASSWLGLTDDRIAGGGNIVRILPGSPQLSWGQSTGLAVSVTDSLGRILPEPPTVSVTSLFGGTLDPVTGEAKNGWFYTKYTPSQSTGTDILTAGVGGGIGTAGIQIIASEPEAPFIRVYCGSPRLAPGKTMSVGAFVSVNGAPSNGHTVFFRATNGGDFATVSGVCVNGWFSTTFTAGAVVGTNTVEARTANGGLASTEVLIASNVPGLRVLSLSLFPPTVLTDQSTNVVVQITDELGNPVDGKVSVNSSLEGTFLLSGSSTGSPGNCSGDSAAGIFQATFSSKATGLATITAFFNAQEVSETLTVNKGNRHVSLSMPETRIKADSTTRLPFSVYYFDDLDRPVAEADVLFKCEGGSFETENFAKTNSSGFCSNYFKPGSTPGTFVLSVWIEGRLATTALTIF